MSIFGAPISSESRLKWIPLLSPAIKKNSCEIDRDLLTYRAQIITYVAIALVFPVLPLVPYYPIVIIVVPLSSIMGMVTTLILDSWLTEKAADVKAAEEYIKLCYPSYHATYRIQNRANAAKCLALLQGNFNKRNENGECILSSLYNFETFKTALNHGAQLTQRNARGEKILFQVTAHKDYRYLKYALENHFIQVEDLSSNDQAEIWRTIENREAAFLLKKHGFDPNTTNSQGYTALMMIVKNASRTGTSGYGNFTHVQRVSALLNCGADATQRITNQSNEDYGKNAIELNTHHAMANILNNSWNNS